MTETMKVKALVPYFGGKRTMAYAATRGAGRTMTGKRIHLTDLTLLNGWDSYFSGRPVFRNPHPHGTLHWHLWRRGWAYAEGSMRFLKRVRTPAGVDR